MSKEEGKGGMREGWSTTWLMDLVNEGRGGVMGGEERGWITGDHGWKHLQGRGSRTGGQGRGSRAGDDVRQGEGLMLNII